MACVAIELAGAPSSPSGEYCLPSCEGGATWNLGFACEDGQAVPCAEASDSSCSVCGCPSNLRCVPEEGCVELLEVGEACAADADCKSANCGDDTKLCRVPLGQPCDETNCDLCFRSEDWSYCSVRCSTDSECPGSLCLFHSLASTSFGQWCFPPCQDACSGECVQDDFGANQACDCSTCGFTMHWPAGTECVHFIQCDGNECYRGPGGSMCSGSCDSDADCDDGFACVDTCTPTSADCDDLCLPVCDGECERGTCAELPSPDGGNVSVCDVLATVGDPCRSDADCRSGFCGGGYCVASANSLPNGAACDSNGDCASGACVNEVCNGGGLIGDACASDADCGVGTCCPSGDAANTCALDCG